MKRIAIVIFSLTLLSCLKDEVIEINRVNDMIKYGVVTNASTRAADIYCNNNLPASFNVWAEYDGLTYIEDIDVVRDGSSWSSENDVYWPAGEVAFYAHVNAGDKFRWPLSGSPVIEEYTVNTDPSRQLDLLYAVKTQEKGNGTVQLNFRHALSQIVFQAKNTNPGLHIIVKGVKVCNLGNKGTFTYPDGNTDDTIINHDGNGEIITNGAIGNWNSIIGGATDYSISFSEAIPVEYTSDGSPVSLTSTKDKPSESTLKEFKGNAMLLLPQKTTAWIPEAGNGNPNASTQTGTYFLIDCAIYQNAKDVDGNDVRVYLWGSQSATKEVAIPAAINWSQGNKYVYTFIFGDGNGGYNPDSIDPEEVLFPIEFDVYVDDFIPGTEEDVTMDEVVPEILPDLTWKEEAIDYQTLRDGGTITIDGSNYPEYTHLKLFDNSNWPMNQEEALKDVIEGNGKIIVKNFKNGAVSIKVAFTTIEIIGNTLETIDVAGTNVKLIIKNNIIDGKNRYHWRWDISGANPASPLQTNDFGIGFFLYSPQYDLTFEGNTIRNTVAAAFRINGWGLDMPVGATKTWGQTTSLNLNNIPSFKNNEFQVKGYAINFTGDCTYFTYDSTKDATTEGRQDFNTYDGSYSLDKISEKAEKLIESIEAAENNNTFIKASGVEKAYKFRICTSCSLTGKGLYYSEF